MWFTTGCAWSGCVTLCSSVPLFKLVAEFVPRQSSTAPPHHRRLSLNPLGTNAALIMFLGFMSNGGTNKYSTCDSTCVLVRGSWSACAACVNS